MPRSPSESVKTDKQVRESTVGHAIRAEKELNRIGQGAVTSSGLERIGRFNELSERADRLANFMSKSPKGKALRKLGTGGGTVMLTLLKRRAEDKKADPAARKFAIEAYRRLKRIAERDQRRR